LLSGKASRMRTGLSLLATAEVSLRARPWIA
jgi:hypothetical protein